MKDCCLAVIALYTKIRDFAGVREGAALYCVTCTSRLVLHDGVWRTE